MKKEKQEVSIVRSSAAEYLTFITATGKSDVNAVYCDENVWLTQKMMGLLYNVETHTINYHLKKIFADGEVDESAVIRKFRITADRWSLPPFRRESPNGADSARVQKTALSVALLRHSQCWWHKCL